MANFIHTNIGWFNLDNLLRVRSRTRSDNDDLLETVSGEIIHCKISGSIEDALCRNIIPAAGAAYAVATVLTWTRRSERPADIVIHQDYQPILGWRDMQGYMAPLYRQELASNQRAFLSIGDKYHELCYDGGIYEGDKAMREYVASEAQIDWEDRIHKRAPAS